MVWSQLKTRFIQLHSPYLIHFSVIKHGSGSKKLTVAVKKRKPSMSVHGTVIGTKETGMEARGADPGWSAWAQPSEGVASVCGVPEFRARRRGLLDRGRTGKRQGDGGRVWGEWEGK